MITGFYEGALVNNLFIYLRIYLGFVVTIQERSGLTNAVCGGRHVRARLICKYYLKHLHSLIAVYSYASLDRYATT